MPDIFREAKYQQTGARVSCPYFSGVGVVKEVYFVGDTTEQRLRVELADGTITDVPAWDCHFEAASPPKPSGNK